MKSVVVIPARGGSKGVPNKNIKCLNDKPLIQYTLEAALEVFKKEDILVSTDSENIKGVVENLGIPVPFLRPAELATDTASSQDVLLHAVNWFERVNGEVDIVILLQPTSPFRQSGHIQEAMKLYQEGIDMVVSVRLSKANPYFNLFEENEQGFLHKSKNHIASRRQDVPQVWEYNGAIYMISKKSLLEKPMSEFSKNVKYEMDEISSLDIDTPLDWDISTMISTKFHKNNESH